MIIRCPNPACREYIKLTIKGAHKRKVSCPKCKTNLYLYRKDLVTKRKTRRKRKRR